MLSRVPVFRPALAASHIGARHTLARHTLPASAMCVRRHSTHPLPRTVPKSTPVSDTEVGELARFILSARRLVVLTGAGVSTESNIPDYRSPGVGLYVSSNHRPILHKEFVEQPHKRQRYWARNYVGFEKFNRSKPNSTHQALAHLEQQGHLHYLITQNVDSLHTMAGSVRVLELHGTGHYVRCMRCGERTPRWLLQTGMLPLRMSSMSPSAIQTAPAITAEHVRDLIGSYHTDHSGPGMLKPDLVFFGGTVPVPKVEFAQKAVRQSDALLVLGSSLQVYSGYRFVRLASELGLPVCIVNIGPTRGDPHASLKVDGRVGDVLPRAIRALRR